LIISIIGLGKRDGEKPTILPGTSSTTKDGHYTGFMVPSYIESSSKKDFFNKTVYYLSTFI